jgi:hypothetical protein
MKWQVESSEIGDHFSGANVHFHIAGSLSAIVLDLPPVKENGKAAL